MYPFGGGVGGAVALPAPAREGLLPRLPPAAQQLTEYKETQLRQVLVELETSREEMRVCLSCAPAVPARCSCT